MVSIRSYREMVRNCACACVCTCVFVCLTVFERKCVYMCVCGGCVHVFACACVNIGIL